MITKPVRAPRRGALVRSAASAALLLIFGALPARALDEQSGEAKAIEACEKQLCTMLLQRKPTGGDLKCQLSKTWQQSTIKEAESSAVKWGHGDARCSVDLNLTRAAIVSAMTSEEFTYEVPKHTANCVVEQDGQVTKVTAKLAPKIIFKNGKAEKVWINLKDVDGPMSIKATIWTVARLADGVGLFHRKMIKSMNKFVEKSCAKKYPQIANVAALPATTKDKVKKVAKPAQEPAK
ncbi:MAG: hypothetical protein ABW200_03665 [Hyphomicrobiaceae bacterium]